MISSSSGATSSGDHPIQVLSPQDIKKLDPAKILNVNIGVMGHVDSGKTSLVKTLSTLLSTASLDKSQQSRERGMTLDLGFSALVISLPASLKQEFSEKEALQITLVDCPGHASLIRTIIGGAQIIDMVLLVIDSTKGLQAQTAECLVVAEQLLANHEDASQLALICALNKVDLLPQEGRASHLTNLSKKLTKLILERTQFQSVKMVGVSACVGGEKVAAGDSSGNLATHNIDALLKVLTVNLKPPRRTRDDAPFHFAIDHCFPIRGQGTVLTGTVLSGTAKINSVIEFPTLAVQRKVKSMQMFRRPVTQIKQGDRAGICVSNFDAKLIERGVAATPGTVKLLDAAVCLIRKVKFFQLSIKTGQKFHISVGHVTVMATLTILGLTKTATSPQEGEESNDNPAASHHTNTDENLGGGLPRLSFNWDQDFVHQDTLLDSSSAVKGVPKTNVSSQPPLHWALLEFQTPVYCPLDSLIIGSRLDTDGTVPISSNNRGASNDSPSTAAACRLAFSGRLVSKFDAKHDANRIKIYTPKQKQGTICRLGDPYRRNGDTKIVRYEVFGTDLFKKETNMKQFVGMHVETAKSGDVGVITSSFGTSGKFRVNFPGGTDAREGEPLLLKFKRYAHDLQKVMHQDAVAPKSRPGIRLESPKESKKMKKSNSNKSKHQPPSATSTSPSPCAVDDSKKGTIMMNGEIASLKGDVMENGKYPTAIVSGFFSPEVNIREKVGFNVICGDEKGVITAPFGKAGKCKVSFEDGVSAPIGSKCQLLISSPK